MGPRKCLALVLGSESERIQMGEARIGIRHSGFHAKGGDNVVDQI